MPTTDGNFILQFSQCASTLTKESVTQPATYIKSGELIRNCRPGLWLGIRNTPLKISVSTINRFFHCRQQA